MPTSADWCLLTLQGLAKNVGVSNMSIKKMQDVLKYAKVRRKAHEEQTLSASLYRRRGCLLAPARWGAAVVVQMLRCLAAAGTALDDCHCRRQPITA